MSGRHFLVRRLAIAILVWAVGFVGFPTLIAEAACSDTQLVPTLGRWEVNQGLGSYDRLTRGKDILVRLYMTLPPASTCTLGGSQGVTIKAASLTVSATWGGSTHTSSPALNASNALSLSSIALTAPPANTDSKHDPLFLVAGSIPISVSPPATGTPAIFPSFPATFSVQVTYDQKVSATKTNAGRTALFSTTKTIDQESKAIRILFQPIGDGTSTVTQFSESDRTAVQNAVQTVLRVLPVPAGPAGSLILAGRTGGIRYDINPSLLDVSGIAGAFQTKTVGGVTATKFCATQTVFTSLAPLLGTRLDNFNAAQTAARPDGAEDAADYIVGVYGESISFESGQGCALGMAAVGGKISVARAVSDKPKVGSTPAQVSYTGAVIAQEMTHNLGGQPYPRSSTYHSSYVPADNTDPDGAYNIASGAQLTADKTVMNVDSSTSPWDNSVTVLEKPDFEYALCRFGGTIPTGAECTVPVPGGTLTGVAAMDAYVAAGNTATGLIEGYHAASARTTDDPDSPYRLLVLKGGLVLNNPAGTPPGTGVPLSFIYTHGQGLPNPPGLFSFALPSRLAAGADELKLVTGGFEIFDVHKNPAPPTVTSITPATNDLLAPGQSAMFTNSVTPPVIPPKPDVYFLLDSTGSETGLIGTLKCSSVAILNTVSQSTTSARFGAGDYKDFPYDPYVFKNAAPIPASDDGGQAALDAIGRNIQTPCLPTASIASTITQGGAPNYADTYVTPYVATHPATIKRWKAQFTGGRLGNGRPGVPSGIQLKVLRRDSDNPNVIHVISAGTVHDPRPTLQTRFGGSYPSFATEDSAIEFGESGLDILAGDIVGVTIHSDPVAGAYFYPLVSSADTRIVTRDEPAGGSIDLNDSFTGTLQNLAPALQVDTTFGWTASGGSDRPEGSLFALTEISAPTSPGFDVKWRSDSTRILVWIGDNPDHDPVCKTLSGLANDITEASATADLSAANIKVIAVSVNSGGSSLGLNGDPTSGSTDYTPPCSIGGSAGQATRIVNATGGVLKEGISATGVARAIEDSLQDLPATVTPQVVSGMCSGDLSVTFAPTSQTVTSGTETAPFSETVNVASGATDGLKNCTIEFLVNGKRVTLPDESPDPAFRQVVTIAVGATKVTVQAQAVSYNANSVADFIYHCPGTPFFPIATAVPHTGGAPTGTPPFNLMFQTQIDSALVPGGICTVSTLVTDMFQRSALDLGDPNSTTTLHVTRKPPRDVAIYTPTDGTKFGTSATVVATGGGSDPESGTMSFAWSLTGPSTSLTATGPRATFVPPGGSWALGDYTLTLTGSDVPLDGTGTASRTFSVVGDSALPAVYSFVGFFAPAKNWPDANQVNGGQGFTPKWILRDLNGLDVTTSNAIAGAQLQEVSCVNRAAIGSPVFNWQVGATMIRYDSKGGQWVANVAIPSGIGKCYTWTLELADGSLHPLFVQAVK